MTVSRYCSKQVWGKSYAQRVKPMLSEKNIRDRVNFCKIMVAEGYSDDSVQGRILRSHVLFTDKSPVLLNPKPNRQNSRVRTAYLSKIPPIQVPKFGLKIMVTGGISCYGKRELIIVDQKATVDSQYYCTTILPKYAAVLQDVRKFPKQNISVLMEDSTTCHTSKFSIKEVEKHAKMYGKTGQEIHLTSIQWNATRKCIQGTKTTKL